jgi:NAD(P)-dependent dehydrogenase (short-subunit alcohol dehydrogenase family)
MMDNCGLGIGNTMGYANSKFANSLFNKELAKRLKGTRVTTYSLCPGLARTNILQHYTGKNTPTWHL